MDPDELPVNVRDVMTAAGALPRSIPGIVGIAVVGSWARSAGRVGSDVDLVVLSTARAKLLEDESWHDLIGAGAVLVGSRRFGLLEERRLRLTSGLEVEVGIVPRSWAAVPPDAGTARVVRDGIHVLFDPERLLANLIAAAEVSEGGEADEPEVVLAADGVTTVVKVGGTVRRPVRPFTGTVQQYLTHLRSQGVDFVPEPLGYDEQGREVLSFVDGEPAPEPLPEWATSEQALRRLAGLIRRLHDAAEGWDPPADAVWGGIAGATDVITDPLFDVPELVSHRDYCRGNVIFRDQQPEALIDFDLSRPTTRVADIANALYWWAPLRDPEDRPEQLRTVDIPARVRAFADAYGMTREQRGQLAPVAVKMVRNFHRTAKHAATVDPVFHRWWVEGVRERMPRAERWIADNADAIAADL